jgi:hypothetical protein
LREVGRRCSACGGAADYDQEDSAGTRDRGNYFHGKLLSKVDEYLVSGWSIHDLILVSLELETVARSIRRVTVVTRA